MSERERRMPSSGEVRAANLIRIVPHPLTVYIADKFLGEGLTEEGHKKLKKLVKKMLKGEKVQASREFPQIYRDCEFEFNFEDRENIPTSGATLFVGNHTRSGPLFGMGQYFETARIVYEERTDVGDDRLREPVAIAQRGLTRVVKLPGVRKFMWTIPFTGQFYDMAVEALNWVTVDPPRFDSSGQIVNRQRLPKRVAEDLIAGGAVLWFPQGKHEEPGNLAMPKKSEGFLIKLKDDDVKLVAMKFMPAKKSLSIFFSDAVHIQDIPQSEGQIDMAAFVARYLEPLGPKS